MRSYLLPFLVVVWLMLTAGTISQLTIFQDNQVLTAAQLNNEFGQLISTINNLDNANIASGANIDPLKISAVIDGSGLERSGVTGALSAKVDGFSLEIASDQLRVKSDLAGNGLSGGGASALAVNVDGSTLEINSDSLRVKDGGITKQKLATTSASYSSYVTFSSTGDNVERDATGLSVSFTSTGRPVWIFFEKDFTGIGLGEFYVGRTATGGGATSVSCDVFIYRGASKIHGSRIYSTLTPSSGGVSGMAKSIPASSVNKIDFPSAGSHTYKVALRASGNSGTTSASCETQQIRMGVVEL